MASSGFFWIILYCTVYGVMHSILAANVTKTWAARTFGEAAYQRFYRLFFVVMAGVMVLPVLALVPLLPDQPLYTIPAPWLYLTMLVQITALVGILAGVMQTGAFRFLGMEQVVRPVSAPPQPERLVVDGLYHWVRHPLYAFSLLLLWLTPVMTWNVLALDLGFSAYLLVGTIFEERKLVEQFGEAYRSYRRRTPRIVPGIKIT